VIQEDEQIPNAVRLWPESSWKKYYIAYLVEKDRYFVYPRVSFTTNFSDPGTHDTTVNAFQVPLAMGEMNYSFSTLENAISVYDTYCEILPEKLKMLVPGLQKYDFECDLYGLKELRLIQSKYILSSKTYHSIGDSCIPAVESFGLKMRPMESNIIHKVQGRVFQLFEINKALVDSERPIDPGTFFQYFYNERKLIPSCIVSQEINRVPWVNLVLEIMNRVMNKIRKFRH